MSQISREHFLSSLAPHRPRLMKFFASRVPNASEAADLVQEVYLRLLRLEHVDLIRSPEAYLFTVAANIAREHALKKAAQPAQIALSDTLEDQFFARPCAFEDTTPEELATRQQRIGALEGVLAQLSPKARATLVWHRRDGLTYKQIASRLGISRDMVKKYLAQSLAHCRKHLDEERGGRDDGG